MVFLFMEHSIFFFMLINVVQSRYEENVPTQKSTK